MSCVFDFSFTQEGNDGPFLHANFSTRSGVKPGIISKETLAYIDAHAANRRERNVFIRLSASRFIAREPDAALIFIDGVPEEMKPKLPKIPPLSAERVDQAIRVLRDLQDRLAVTKFDVVQGHVDTLLQGAGTIATAPPWPFYCYRAVNYLKERATCVDQLGAPKANRASFRRCSPEGTAMFYCSFDQQIAMREIRVKEGDLVHVSAWKMAAPFYTFSMPPGRAPGQDLEAFSKLKSFINDIFTEKIVDDPIEDEEGRDQSHRYKISAAFGSLYAHGRLDPMNPHLILPLGGIFYQSVIDPLQENLAINSTIAATHLSFDIVFQYIVTRVTPEGRIEIAWRGAGRALSPEDSKRITWIEDPRDPRLLYP